MRRIVLVLLAITAGSLLAAASAGAQAASSATPAKAGKASNLHFEVDGVAPPIGGRLPSALAMIAPPGFKLNLDALSKRCSVESAKLNECPQGSLMGNGTLQVIVTAPDGVRVATIPIQVYLHSDKTIMAVAFVFGWRIVPATLNASNGIVMAFDPLPAGPPFPNVSYALQRISFDFRAKRVVEKRKVRRVKHKREVIVVKRTLNLITNPRTCQGAWASSVALRFPDASVAALAAPTTCTPA
jgi:hypothetical protein